ncbi:hypothetical protein F4804DRAFT_183348 [Jackrogersella minutella]|nr:hypothetical protein F4804DRAFT_183348 [Jackrogersella minutella]
MAPTAKNAGGNMPFIVSTGAKLDPELRKFVRSHVMQGKNRGRILRPRYQKSVELNVKESNKGTSSKDDECADESQAPAYPPTIPNRVGSDLSFMPLADTMDESTVSVIIEFSTIAKKALFPLESCINFGPRTKAWMEALSVDPAYLNAMAFSAKSYFDLKRGDMSSSGPAVADPHVVKTLRLLRERLELPAHGDMTQFLSGTAAVVLCLAFHAHIVGEYEAARHHMLGLRRIVDLGGGLSGLKDNVKVIVEILRCDIGMALHSGFKPIFFADLEQEPYWPYPDYSLYVYDSTSVIFTSSVEEEIFLSILEPDVAIAWRVIKQFTVYVNHAAVTGFKLPKEALLDSMASVMYRLLHKSSLFARGSFDEAVRLGLLAFSSSIFLQWAGVRLPYTHFPAVYRDCLVNLDLESADSSLASASSARTLAPAVDESGGNPPSPWSSRLLIWLLTVGYISILDSSDGDAWLKPWLRVNLELCEMRSWPAMHHVLNSFMWAKPVHDSPGEALFNSTMSLSPCTGFC